MVELIFGPQADDFLTDLEAKVDGHSQRLLGRLHTALDRLELNPGDETCRRRRLHIGRHERWAIPVVSDNEDWLILWKPGTQTGEVVVDVIIRET